MKTNKPEVVAWEVRTISKPVTQFGASDSYPEWAEGDPDLSITPLVRLSDYEELQAECERWKRGSEIRDEQNQDLHSFIVELKAENEKLRKDAEFGRSVLSKREPGKKYGCHCDLEEDMEPDGCVIDEGNRLNCVYARHIETKEQCEYWRIIASDADMQEEKE